MAVTVYDGIDWAGGPARVYGRLAHAVVEACPVPVAGARVLDAGAGTGVVGALAADAGAAVVAADLSVSMLRANPFPSVRADLGALPFRRRFDAVLGGCVINHFDEPVPIVRQLAGVVRPGGAVVLSTFPGRHDLVKETIDGVAAAHGWRAPEWYLAIRARQAEVMATAEQLAAVGVAAGLDAVHVRDLDVPMGLTAEDAVEYRLGLGHFRPWIDGRDDVRAEALAAVAPIVDRWAMPLLVLAGLSR